MANKAIPTQKEVNAAALDYLTKNTTDKDGVLTVADGFYDNTLKAAGTDADAATRVHRADVAVAVAPAMFLTKAVQADVANGKYGKKTMTVATPHSTVTAGVTPGYGIVKPAATIVVDTEIQNDEDFKEVRNTIAGLIRPKKEKAAE